MMLSLAESQIERTLIKQRIADHQAGENAGDDCAGYNVRNDALLDAKLGAVGVAFVERAHRYRGLLNFNLVTDK
jgi:hypothetical protein